MPSSNLGKAAFAPHPDAPETREDRAMDQASAVLERKTKDVAMGLRRAATREQLDQGVRKAVDKAADYIDNNRGRFLRGYAGIDDHAAASIALASGHVPRNVHVISAESEAV